MIRVRTCYFSNKTQKEGVKYSERMRGQLTRIFVPVCEMEYKKAQPIYHSEWRIGKCQQTRYGDVN
jgi:hypothetical protein